MNARTVATYQEQIVAALHGIDAAALDAVVDVLDRCYRVGGTVLTAGNGGSASTASHLVADLNKFAAFPRTPLRAIDLGAVPAAVTAYINDEGWDDVYAHLAAPWLDEHTVVVAFSVHGGSGWSNNLVRLADRAAVAGATTVAFSGAGGGTLGQRCDISVVVPTPDEDSVTVVTESLHVVLHHYVVWCLNERIAGAGGRCDGPG